MRIPDSFKAAQAAAFQDKTITHYAAVTTCGTRGTETTAPAASASGEYHVNLRPVRNELEAKEYGLTIGRDAIVTSSAAISVPIGDYIRHGGLTYRVLARIEHDAYVVLTCKAVTT